MRKKVALIVFLLLSLLLASITSVSCGSTPKETINLNGFSIALSAPRIEFPDSIAFDIEVKSEANISKIALHYQVDKLSPIPVTSVAFPQFETAPKVKASWKWDMRKSGALPPGARVDYWWSIEDAEGNSAETDVVSFSFGDNRHSWQSLHSNRIVLYWYSGSQSFGQELRTTGEQALDRLSEDIGIQLEQEVKIYIYASVDDLQEAMIFPQEWTGGVAYPDYGTVVLGISTGDLDWGKGAIAHELAHLVVHQAVFSGYGTQLPTWLDEGLAMYAEGGLSPAMQGILDDAIERQQLISVRSLSSSFPADAEAAYLAYAESYSLVEFLLQEGQGGKAKMLQLLDAFKQGSGYVEALEQVYGLDIDQLDTLWRQYIGSVPDSISLLYIGRESGVCVG